MSHPGEKLVLRGDKMVQLRDWLEGRRLDAGATLFLLRDEGISIPR